MRLVWSSLSLGKKEDKNRKPKIWSFSNHEMFRLDWQANCSFRKRTFGILSCDEQSAKTRIHQIDYNWKLITVNKQCESNKISVNSGRV